MNTLLDVKAVVENYYIKGGQVLETAREPSEAKEAEKLWREGLSKLEALKLSAADRRNFRLLRETFKLAIKAAQALQKGQYHKAESLIEESADYVYRYQAAMIARAVS